MLETASDGAPLGNATDRSTAALLDSPQAERKQMASSRDTSPRELALQRCEENIAWYVSQKRLQRFLDTALQLSIILAAGATAFLASFDYPPDMKWIVVLPAVITTVATGMSSASTSALPPPQNDCAGLNFALKFVPKMEQKVEKISRNLWTPWNQYFQQNSPRGVMSS